ncbi:MAG TPA: MFS transporter, partial [Caulobacteraceae bacterium]|nr:MFS transporter [Caulobacteraceae bacterium]
ASAAGLLNFLRTTSAAFATSLVTTGWDNQISRDHANMAGAINDPEGVMATMTASGLSPAQALQQLDGLIQGQAVMTATDHMFLITVVVFVIAAAAVWFSPRAKPAAPIVGAH